MALVQNDVGKPVPGRGATIRNEVKSGMNLTSYKIANPPSGSVGKVGSGSGVLGGGSLSPRSKGNKR